ncbi:response regulator [Saccharomonospora saliphila]|uniref:response regulator n=1 Tax=Saccharomonospora saliphila TaxID=369829 RepID=UPI00036EC205|nr:response regulator [Saccharomonospora saliphila]
MIRTLVVDDDFMVAKVHGGYVRRTPGFDVVGTAHTGAEALRAARDLRPDLVLLDIYLPDLDGLAVLRELRGERETSDVDVVVITAARDVDTVRQALRGGAAHYLIKPFSYPALREQLDHVGSRHRALERLSADAAARQQDVDAVFGGRTPGTATLPKGLTEQTAELVRDALTAHPEGLSASECARLTSLSRPSARRYLEHFAETGRAEVRLRYGGTGRPERQYHWLARPAR